MSMSFHPAPAVPQPRNEYGGHDRRAQDPIHRLARRLDAVCVTAVDPLQIAAALEADGVTDAIAAARYGASDVFALANELYRIVPLRPPVAPKGGRGASDTLRDVLHGPLYALPGVVYASLLPRLEAGPATLALALGVALGWSWSQGMVRVALRLEGRGRDPAAAAVLRRGIGLGMLWAAALGIVLSGTLGIAAWLLTGQVIYQAVAVALTVRRREARLLVSAAPATLAAVADLVGIPGAGAATTVAGVVATFVLALAAVAYETRTRNAEVGSPLVDRKDLADALPSALYAALAAAIVAGEPLRALHAGVPAGLGWSLLPLVLTMGVLEWQVRRFRATVARAANRSVTIVAFNRQVFAGIVTALAFYVGTVGAASWTLLGLAPRWGLETSGLTPAMSAYGVLGVAFFLAIALTAQGHETWVVLAAAMGCTSGLVSTLIAPSAPATMIAATTFLAPLLLVAPRWLTELRGYRDVIHPSERAAPARSATRRRRWPWRRSSPSRVPTVSSART